MQTCKCQHTMSYLLVSVRGDGVTTNNYLISQFCTSSAIMGLYLRQNRLLLSAGIWICLWCWD